MTEEEQALKEVKKAEAEAGQGTSLRAGHVSSGLNFPMTDVAARALQELTGSSDNLVQLVCWFVLAGFGLVVTRVLEDRPSDGND